MKKIMNRILAVILVLAILGGCGFGGWRVYQNYHGGAVEVYSISELSTSYWGDEKQTEGFVTTDKLQSEFLSETQTVEEIKVKEGQRVKKGDILFTYDSTLNDLDLKHKQIEVQKKELEISNTQKELKVIRTYRAGVPIPGSSSGYKPSKPEKPKPEKPTYPGLFLVSGTGTKKDPYCYIWKDTFTFSDDLLAAAMQGKDEAYVKFYLNGKEVPTPQPDPTPTPTPDPEPTPDPKPDPDPDPTPDPEPEPEPEPDPEPQPEPDPDPEEPGDSSEEATVEQTAARSNVPFAGDMPVTPTLTLLASTDDEEDYSAAWTMHCQHTMSGYRYVMVTMTVGGVERTVAEPLPEMTEEERYKEEDPWEDWSDDGFVDGIVYTAAEIAEMVRQHVDSLKTMDIEYRQLKLECAKLEKELNNSAVYSALDGIVTTLNSPDELEAGMPIVKVSGGGGYIVKGSISELDLDAVEIGQSVTVNNWATGGSYEGSIQEISDYPVTNNGYYWGDGNNNVSYYTFTVTVDDTADLEENSYVDMSYTPNVNGGGSNIYLMKAFVRSEGGKSYIYLDNNGTLEKVYVTTGRDLWGSYIEITSGNVPSDGSLAFPYGQKVREKAPTTPGSMDSLYGY